MGIKAKPVLERIAARSIQEGKCRVWTGYRNEHGYGELKAYGRIRKVHRVVWAEAFGPIPEGMVIRHKCNNPPCCLLEHLEIGTQLDNVQDMVRAGRCKKESVGNRINCPEGKSWCSSCKQFLPADNFGVDSHRWSGIDYICKTCKRAKDRARYTQKKKELA